MNKLIVALIAGAFATVAAAQTAMPGQTPADKSKQKEVSAVTQAGSGSSASTQKTAAEQAANTAVSKEAPKMTTQEKNAAIKAANKSGVNPNNDAGVAATAAQQKANTAESKMVPKQNADLKGKAGQQALEKELQQKASK